MVSFEFVRIGPGDDGVVTYFASPRGAAPTLFRLVEITENKAVFADPTHDFPQRVLYWLTPDGALHARVEGTIRRQARSEESRWTKR